MILSIVFWMFGYFVVLVLVLTAIETGLALLVQNTTGAEAAQHDSDYDDGCHDTKHYAQQ
jgi:hypothetical protein